MEGKLDGIEKKIEKTFEVLVKVEGKRRDKFYRDEKRGRI